jgi:N-acetyl-beta-hexosaminidase
MVVPRLQALSEVQWTSRENRNYERFEKKMTNRHFKIMEILGLNYRPF